MRASNGWALLSSILIACGGGTAPSSDTDSAGVAPAPVASETNAPSAGGEVAAVATGAELAEGEPAEDEEVAAAEGAEAAPEETSAPAEPEVAAPEPLVASSEEDVKNALFQASADIISFRRLVDPEVGIGVIPAEGSPRHVCDMGELASQPDLGFVVGISDDFDCDRELERCTVRDPDGRGHVFHFRQGDGDTLWLTTITHHERRVPRRDSRKVRAFVDAAEGVCDLRRSLLDAQALPARFSVFVSGYTGLVPETVDEHHCGEDAAAAYRTRVAPVVSSGAPDRCDRDPARCSWERGDEEVTVYGGEEGATAIAVTRPGMRRNLDRGQERELGSFLRGVRGHDCE